MHECIMPDCRIILFGTVPNKRATVKIAFLVHNKYSTTDATIFIPRYTPQHNRYYNYYNNKVKCNSVLCATVHYNGDFTIHQTMFNEYKTQELKWVANHTHTHTPTNTNHNG